MGELPSRDAMVGAGRGADRVGTQRSDDRNQGKRETAERHGR